MGRSPAQRTNDRMRWPRMPFLQFFVCLGTANILAAIMCQNAAASHFGLASVALDVGAIYAASPQFDDRFGNPSSPYGYLKNSPNRIESTQIQRGTSVSVDVGSRYNSGSRFVQQQNICTPGSKYCQIGRRRIVSVERSAARATSNTRKVNRRFIRVRIRRR